MFLELNLNMHDVYLVMQKHIPFFTTLLSIEIWNSNKYVMLKFNANLKLKLSIRWFKYVDPINLNNSGVGKFKAPSHNTP
jgi:hypothetical protein